MLCFNSWTKSYKNELFITPIHKECLWHSKLNVHIKLEKPTADALWMCNYYVQVYNINDTTAQFPLQ